MVFKYNAKPLVIFHVYLNVDLKAQILILLNIIFGKRKL